MPERGPRSSERRPSPGAHQAETQITASSTDLVALIPQLAALTVLAHPEAARVGERVLLPELGNGGKATLGRVEPAFLEPRTNALARPLDDLHLSRRPLRLVGRPGGAVEIVRAGSPTPVKIDGERLEESRILDRAEIERGVTLLLGRRITLLLHLDSSDLERGPDLGMIGTSLAMRQLREQTRLAARLEIPVLIRGESGTGKELLARALHETSHRADGPYLAVNMAAVPPSLAASELFGAARGAFTGADRRRDGFFQRAAGGVLFLDEIGETPDEVQPLLLRALESGEVQPVGGSEPRRVDVRLVAATDADLEARVSEGFFRAPLLHRLLGHEILVPPLRERRSDFGRLLYSFLELELTRLGLEPETATDSRPWPAASLVARLAGFDWPGNIRQLRNVARQMAIAHASGKEFQLDATRLAQPPSVASTNEPVDRPHLEATSSPTNEPAPTPPAAAAPHGWRPAFRKPSEVGEEELLATLRANRFELKASARALGISRGSLYTLVEENPSIRKASDLGPEEIRAAITAASNDLTAAAEALQVSLPALRRQMRILSPDGGW